MINLGRSGGYIFKGFPPRYLSIVSPR